MHLLPTSFLLLMLLGLLAFFTIHSFSDDKGHNWSYQVDILIFLCWFVYIYLVICVIETETFIVLINKINIYLFIYTVLSFMI